MYKKSMEIINVTILNNVFCKTDKAGKKLLDPCLVYKKTYWKQTQNRKIEESYYYSMIGRRYFFLTGFLPRIEKFCKEKGYTLLIEKPVMVVPPNDQQSFQSFLEKTKTLLGNDFRENQLEKQISLIRAAVDQKRGLLISPTGTGKTTLALGIASYFPTEKTLYMCHTKTLVTQTAKEFERYGFLVTKVMEGNKDQSGNIVVATRQSLISMELEKYGVVMVDEVHHISDENCSYGTILQKIDTPLRFGFTATFDEVKLQAKFAIEGNIGQVVGELTMEKAQEMKILAKPKLHIIKVPRQFIDSRNYQDVYNEAVVYSRTRNRLIVKTIKGYTDKNKIVLVFVTKLAHGKEIQKIALSIYNMKIEMIQGITETSVREEIKQSLKDKKTKAIIATTVWTEGVNIPALDCIILASGGKSELELAQKMGRGMRLSEGKNEMVLVDFIDNVKYLENHCLDRLTFYIEKGWLK